MALANTLLAPWAVPHEGMLGRAVAEPEDATRFPFQRDRDRIIHTQAFRRLKGKTQVFVEGRGDHFRTRLTHTMEVAQVSRDIARSLRLNEDLAEAIALAHDLGHPPFGHAGETTLDAWMRGHGGRFEHNRQSERVVTLLEEHATTFPGLNLNLEILEGLRKHTTPHDRPLGDHPHAPSLEAQTVNLADEIAYTGHDCEDGLRAGLFNRDEIGEIPLAREALERAAPRGTSLRGALIHLLVHDLLRSSERTLAAAHIRAIDDVYAADRPLIGFSEGLRGALRELRAFLWQRMYVHPDVLERSRQGQDIIRSLCERYVAAPPGKIEQLRKRTGGSLPEAVKDYVAGMTDTFAMETILHL